MPFFRTPPALARGQFYLILSGMLLGTAGITGRLLSRATGLSPVAVAGYRLAVGGLLIVAFLLLTGRRLPRGRPAWARVAVVGGLTGTYQASYFASMALTSVSLATLVTAGAFPVIASALEHATGRRRIDRRALGTIGLALAGLGLLVGFPSGGFGPGAVLASAGLAIAAAGGFAVVTLVAATPVAGLDELSTTGLGFTAGGLLLLPVAGVSAGLGFRPGLAAVGWLVTLGLVPTAVAYTLYFRGLRRISATTAAVITLLEPLTGAVFAAVLLSDRIGPAGLAGAALLAVAVIAAAKAPGGEVATVR